jgi:Cyclin, N-terminal domain/Cyclin, C-terminal domain
MDAYFSPVSLDGSVQESLATYNQAPDPVLLHDQLVRLLSTEAGYTIRRVPCQQLNPLPETERIPLEDWRRKICQWSYRVIDHFRLDREVVSLGMNIFDRFLVAHPPTRNMENDASSCCTCPSCKRSVDSRTYQLGAMTCLYLAIKLQAETESDCGTSRRKRFRLTSFVDLSRGQFCGEDIVAMEQTLLATLRWRVSAPTPMTFVSHLLSMLPPVAQQDRQTWSLCSQSDNDLVLHVLQELSRYLTELTVCLGSELSFYPASQLAFASIIVSMDLVTVAALPLQNRDVFALQVYNLCQWNGGQESIHYLCSKLQKSLWPEMLLDACTDSGHPITIARDNGLLDMDRVYHMHDNAQSLPTAGSSSPPSSPSREKVPVQITADCGPSPVGVTSLVS